MSVQIKTAGYAAIVFFFALMVHCINAFYVEPTYLGFEKPLDYANMGNILAALDSLPWRFSGFAHLPALP